MLKVENRINPGRNQMKIFGESFTSQIDFEGLKFDVMSEIRVYSNDIKIGDLINLEYCSQKEEIMGIGQTYIRLAYKAPSRNISGKIRWFWIERPVYLDDILSMDECSLTPSLSELDIERIINGVEGTEA